MELYIHIPFCKSKCRYCDFLSWSNCENDIEAYVEALNLDIRNSLFGKDFTLDTIYFGGGTPGILNSFFVEEIVKTIRDNAKISDTAEITLEVNPCTVTEEKSKVYHDIGINRISMGVQSFNDNELKLLGRAHMAEDVYKAYHIMRNAGFNNINMDLIQGLPGQSKEGFLFSLNKMIELSPEHISAYELIVEPGTSFYKDYGPESGYVFDEDVQADIYIATVNALKQAGYEQYEISNFSKPGYHSRHNSGYWTGDPYIGCGLGAVGYIGNRRITKKQTLKEYISKPLDFFEEKVSPMEKKQEYIFLGLRMNKGISEIDYENKFGEKFPERIKNLLNKYIPDYVCHENGRYFFTTEGFLISNTILAEIL